MNNTSDGPEQNIEQQGAVQRPKLYSRLKPAIKGFLRTKKGKVTAVFTILILLCAILLVIPQTRYGILGLIVKKTVTVEVVDSVTKKPVSLAVLKIGSRTATTNSSGKITLKTVAAGVYKMKISKKYYADQAVSYTVPILGASKQTTIKLNATGRQVSVIVTNKISGDPVVNAKVSVNGAEASTNAKGEAIIVLPASKNSLSGTISAADYNASTVSVVVTENSGKNTFSLTPAGRLFYLSKQTGIINVMSANLDGSDAKVVVTGTGNESDTDTVLLAARDWKYLALQAKREASANSQLYLVDTASGQLKVIDQGDASFSLVGWSGHTFVYQVNRNGLQAWNSKQQALKSYNAETGKLTTLDETEASGSSSDDYQQQGFVSPYILDDKIVYAYDWYFAPIYQYISVDKKMTINVVNPDGSGKQVVKSFDMTSHGDIQPKLYEPQGIYYRVSNNGSDATYYEYEDGAVKSTNTTDDKFYNGDYPTYLVSPSGKATLWYEPRDGKNTILVGDQNGNNAKELIDQSDYQAYGWYGDDYILLSKAGSELYIAASSKPVTDTQPPLKVTNFHKPTITYPGYGYGYGGL